MSVLPSNINKQESKEIGGDCLQVFGSFAVVGMLETYKSRETEACTAEKEELSSYCYRNSARNCATVNVNTMGAKVIQYALPCLDP